MSLSTINSIEVEPIPVPKIKTKYIKGYELFPEPYGNIFICAKKKSGKTCLINTILQKCISKTTIVYIFCSTIYKDSNYRYIIKWLKNHNISVHTFTEIEPLAQVLSVIDTCDDNFESNSEEEEESTTELMFGNKNTTHPTKRKSKIVACEHLFIFDDLSKQLQSLVLSALLKKNRHYKCKVIISSQYPNDLAIDARKQIDYWLLFGGHSKEKLETIYNDADLHIPFDEFRKYYEYSTGKKYNFFYIDTPNSEMRVNFNQKFN